MSDLGLFTRSMRAFGHYRPDETAARYIVLSETDRGRFVEVTSETDPSNGGLQRLARKALLKIGGGDS